MRHLIYILLLILMGSCSRVEYVPLETVKTDTIYKNLLRVDSVVLHDSIYTHIYSQGDTVYSEKVKYKYKDRLVLRHDTIYRSRVDTIRVPYPIEKKLTKWQKFKMDISTYLLCGIAIIALIMLVRHLLYIHRKK